MDQPTKKLCASCKRPITETRFIPFCSEKCKLGDLSRWFREEYRIASPITDADVDELEKLTDEQQ